VPPERRADVTLELVYSLDAERMLDEADAWWLGEHGFAAANPLIAELHHAAELLRENPRLGMLYQRHRFRGEVRRLLLHSGWHLYYRFHSDRHLIEILAVWFASRGSTPPL
jgi:plasmid stabilization system protein ParE